MASRKARANRRKPARVPLERPYGNCEGKRCKKAAVRKVLIPDDGQYHWLCEQHGLAVELQIQRNVRAETERRLGLR